MRSWEIPRSEAGGGRAHVVSVAVLAQQALERSCGLLVIVRLKSCARVDGRLLPGLGNRVQLVLRSPYVAFLVRQCGFFNGPVPSQGVWAPSFPEPPSARSGSERIQLFLAVIIISMIRFARQVSGVRRISLPKRLQEAAAIPDLSYVRIDRMPPPTKALLVRLAAASVNLGVRDPARPRRLNGARQVTLPAPLMEQIDLKVLEWVYVSRVLNGPGLLIEPAGVL